MTKSELNLSTPNVNGIKIWVQREIKLWHSIWQKTHVSGGSGCVEEQCVDWQKYPELMAGQTCKPCDPSQCKVTINLFYCIDNMQLSISRGWGFPAQKFLYQCYTGSILFKHNFLRMSFTHAAHFWNLMLFSKVHCIKFLPTSSAGNSASQYSDFENFEKS